MALARVPFHSELVPVWWELSKTLPGKNGCMTTIFIISYLLNHKVMNAQEGVKFTAPGGYPVFIEPQLHIYLAIFYLGKTGSEKVLLN